MNLKVRFATISSLLIIVITLIFLFSLFSNSSTSSPAAYKAFSENDQPKVSLLVSFNRQLTLNEVKAWGEGYSMSYYDTLVPESVYRFYIYYNLTKVETFLSNTIKKDPLVKTAEFDHLVEPQFTPNDPEFGNSWHLNNLSFQSAWDSSMGQNITIAMIDTGVDCTHPDLIERCVPGYNFYDNNTNTSDVNGHGTSTAGAAAEAGNNLLNTAGAAPLASIMPVRVSAPNGTAYFSMIAAAVVWAADQSSQGVRVANISYRASPSYSVRNAVEYFASKGGVVTIGAGNSNILETATGAPKGLVVGASDTNNNKWSSSDHGINYINFLAPGVSIKTTLNGGGIGSRSGTSFSAPVAAGLAAMLYTLKPSFTNADIIRILEDTATDIYTPGPDDLSGHGIINPAAAVAQALSEGGVVYPPPGSGGPPQCSDGTDNDTDGLIDYPNDPGCTNAADDDEYNAPPPPPPPPPPPADPGPPISPPGVPETPPPTETEETPEPSNPSTPSEPEKKIAKNITKTPVIPSPVVVDGVKGIGVELIQPESPQYKGNIKILGKSLPNIEVEVLLSPANRTFQTSSDEKGDIEFNLNNALDVGSYTASARVVSKGNDLPYSNEVTLEIIPNKVSSFETFLAVITAMVLAAGLILLGKVVLPKVFKHRFSFK